MMIKAIRHFFYETHLWLSIASGIILFIVCLSGTILTFQDEVRLIAEPGRYYVSRPAGQPMLSADELIVRVETAKQEQGLKVSSITLPEQPNRTVTMTLVVPGQTGSVSPARQGRGRTERSDTNRPGLDRPASGGRHHLHRVFVHPYTGEIVAEGPTAVDPFLRSMLLLHRFLWLPIEIGRPVVGIATIIFCVICITGLILWFPRSWKLFNSRRAWRTGFRWRWRSGFFPFIYDMHKTAGFYILIPSLILGLTGLCWSFSWYRDAASALLGDRIFRQRIQMPEMIEAVDPSHRPILIAGMIARQNQLTPGPGTISIMIPQDRETAMVIRKGRSGFFALAIMDRTQWDPFRGTVIPVEFFGKTVDVERFVDMPLGAQIAASVRGLHLGDITGLSSKIFFFIVCLFATTLPITGVIIWSKKLRVWRNRKRQKKIGSVVHLA